MLLHPQATDKASSVLLDPNNRLSELPDHLSDHFAHGRGPEAPLDSNDRTVLGVRGLDQLQLLVEKAKVLGCREFWHEGESHLRIQS